MLKNPLVWLLAVALVYALVAHYRTGSDFREACAAYGDLGDLSFSDERIGDVEIGLGSVLGIVSPEKVERLRAACADRLRGEQNFLDDLFSW